MRREVKHRTPSDAPTMATMTSQGNIHLKKAKPRKRAKASTFQRKKANMSAHAHHGDVHDAADDFECGICFDCGDDNTERIFEWRTKFHNLNVKRDCPGTPCTYVPDADAKCGTAEHQECEEHPCNCVIGDDDSDLCSHGGQDDDDDDS